MPEFLYNLFAFIGIVVVVVAATGTISFFIADRWG